MTADGRYLLLALLVVVAGCNGYAGPETPVGTSPAGTGVPGTSTETPSTASEPTPYPDRDGDGFSACQERELLVDATPGRVDIYVEVDWTAGAKPDTDEMRELVALYDEAPVDNPNGEQGVDLHVVYSDELPGRDRPLAPENATRYDEHFDNAGRGYHHAVFVEEVEGSAMGRAADGTVLVQREAPNQSRGFHVNVFAHELGHSLGLTYQVFAGVDNYTIPYDRYPSVMNPAGLYETRSFSNGSNSPGDFDDWGYLGENLSVPDTGRLQDGPAC